MKLVNYFQDMWQLAINGQTQGIWFLAAMYALGAGVYSLIFQLRTRQWPFTLGELSASAIEKFGATDWVASDREYVSAALYKYTVSGNTYHGTRISPWKFVASSNARFVLEKQLSSVQRSADGKVKVFYNPKKPNKSYLIVAGNAGIFVTVLVCAVPLVLFYSRYHA